VIKAKALFIVFITSLIILYGQINEETAWKNKKCAVALTYDDALNVHLDLVLPVLDSVGFKGTFYVYGNSTVFQERIEEWKALSKYGHELGNHSLFHPCNGKIKENRWVKKEYDLNNYTKLRMLDEIRVANILLRSIDGKKKRTYAYPCGDKIIEDSDYKNWLKNHFAGARGTTSGINQAKNIDLYDIKVFHVNSNSGKELINVVKDAQEKQALVVFMFHGIDGEHELNISLKNHNKLIKYLKKNEDDIWVAPLIEVVSIF
jgi:peptidoglycan-N-acetylglucosamine deacetylase